MTARTALVTGASRGIGARICGRLAMEGWDLVVTARNREQLEHFAVDLAERSGRTVVPVPADMAEFSPPRQSRKPSPRCTTGSTPSS